MREFEEALAAGRHFPDALNNSAQCLTTYGKVNLAAGKTAEALKYLQMALEKNKAIGEAHFYTAVAQLSSVPPNPDAAIASARLSRGQWISQHGRIHPPGRSHSSWTAFEVSRQVIAPAQSPPTSTRAPFQPPSPAQMRDAGLAVGYNTTRGFRGPPAQPAGRVIVLHSKELAELKRDQITHLGGNWRLERCAGSMSAVIEPVAITCRLTSKAVQLEWLRPGG